MIILSEYELRLIAKNRGIKNYRNMTREKLLSTLDELECNFRTLSERGLNQIAKTQNLSHNELNQAIRMYDQSRDELERTPKMRKIKNRKRMSKEELKIDLLKSKRGLAELFNNNLDDSKISDTRRILNRLRREGSYIKSPEWIRNKRATINPKNEDDDNCFQ